MRFGGARLHTLARVACAHILRDVVLHFWPPVEACHAAQRSVRARMASRRWVVVLGNDVGAQAVVIGNDKRPFTVPQVILLHPQWLGAGRTIALTLDALLNRGIARVAFTDRGDEVACEAVAT